MIHAIFQALEQFNNFLWSKVAFALIAFLGVYFTIASRFFQFRKFPQICTSFTSFFREKSRGTGIHPLKAFFAAIGGCIGIGNIVGICTAVQLGGPGALLWTWMGGILGMLIQYAEIYLGMKYRIPNEKGSYDGGPMYFLPLAYKGQWVATAVSLLLCFYGVELFMFNVMADSISINWNLPLGWVVGALLISTFIVTLGGINRVGEVCSAIIPLFILLYLSMGFWVLLHELPNLPRIFLSISSGAFTPQAAIGGFAGSTVATTLSMGLSRGAYSGDIGVGYNAIIHAESSTTKFGRQASLAIVAIFIDTFVICTMSIFLILLSGHWKEPIDPTLMVQTALAQNFPYMHFFMPFFLLLLGFTTVVAYLAVGVKCAKFLSPKWGPPLYYVYAAITLPLFAFVDSSEAFLIMSLSGAFLLLLNVFGIFLLRKEVIFKLEQ